MSVHTDDLDAAYAKARERGYEITHPLTTEEWGVRRFHVARRTAPSSTSSRTASEEAPPAWSPPRGLRLTRATVHPSPGRTNSLVRA